MGLMHGVREAARHGLLIHRSLERLRRLGVDLNPYLLFREGKGDTAAPLTDLRSEFPSRLLTPDDVPDVAAVSWATREQLSERVRQGHLCVLTRYQGRVAGYTWADLHSLNDAACDFVLGPGEAYLFDAYVVPEFRGRGLAPYLRYACYEELRTLGYHTFYSVSDYFNTPAVRFKRKLGAQSVRLYLEVKLGGRRLGQVFVRTGN